MAIAAFLLAHEGHTQEMEVQRGSWTIFCHCSRCEDECTYEVDNDARKRALERLLGPPLEPPRRGGRRPIGPGGPSRRPEYVGGVGVVDFLLGSAILLSLA